MPGLINLQTDLKSLTYGFDRPNLGSSGQPFITKGIPDELSSRGPDVLLRDGAIRRGIEDVGRIGKFLTTPKGLIFIANQNSLAAQNPKIPGDPRNFYTPTSTLAQLPVNAIGGHLNLLGLDPTSNRNRYIDLYTKNYSSVNTNRLTLLHKLKIGDAPYVNNNPNFNTTSILNIGGDLLSSLENIPTSIIDSVEVNKLGIDNNDPNLLLNYRGGPGAELGILGRTKIKRTSYTIGSKGFFLPFPTDADTNNIKEYQVGRSRPLEYGRDVGQINLNNLLGVSKKEYLSQVVNREIPNDNYDKSTVEDLQKFSPEGDGQTAFIGPLTKNTTLTLDPLLATLVERKQLLRKPFNFAYPLQRGASTSYWFNSTTINSSSAPGNALGEAGLNPANLSPDTLDEFIGYNWSREGDGKKTDTKTYGPEKDSGNKTLSTDPIDSALNPTPSTGRAPKYKNNFKRFKFASPETGRVNQPFSGYDMGPDQFFPFHLKIINADNPSIVDQHIYFQSIIDNFSEQVSPKYDSYKYVGRGYPFQKYTGMERDISLSMTLVANNEITLELLHANISTLTRYLAPNYSEKGYLRGNFFKLTLGDYYVDLPGVVKNFSWSPIREVGTAPGKDVFKAIKIDSFEFTPIADNNNNIVDLNSNFINYSYLG